MSYHSQSLKPRKIAGIFAAVILTTACSGGGDGSPGDTSSANSDLSGTLFVSRRGFTPASGAIYAIDVAARVARLHVTMETDNELDYVVRPSFLEPTQIGNSDLLVGVNGCEERRSFCIERVDATANIERLFTRGDMWLHVPPSMSPDENFIATVASPGQTDGPLYIQLYSTDGFLVEEAQIGTSVIDADVSNIVWTSDNRLVYGIQFNEQGTGLVVTEPGSLAISDDHPISEFQVDPTGQNFIDTVSLAVDGRQLAFDVIPDARADDPTRRAFVLNIDTGESVLISSNPARSVWAPEWSPDGQHLLVNHADFNFFAGGGVQPFQMIVEWTGEPTFIEVFDQNGEVIIDESLFVVDTRTAFDFALFTERWSFNPRKTWIP